MPATETSNIADLSLAALAAAFVARRKTINHQGTFTLAATNEHGVERLDISFNGTAKLRLSLAAWSTDEWWVFVGQRAHQKNAGWTFRHEFRGTFAISNVEMIEKAFKGSMLAGVWSDEERSVNLPRLWSIG